MLAAEAREALDRHEREGTITILTISERRRAGTSLRTRATCSTWKKEEVNGRRREIFLTKAAKGRKRMINLLAGATAALFLFAGAAPSQSEYQTAHRGRQYVWSPIPSQERLTRISTIHCNIGKCIRRSMTGLITFKKAAAVEDFTNVPDISEENIKQLQKELHSKAMIVRANIASRKFIEISIGRFI